MREFSRGDHERLELLTLLGVNTSWGGLYTRWISEEQPWGREKRIGSKIEVVGNKAQSPDMTEMHVEKLLAR